MNISIERIRLQLPAGFEPRAGNIARLLGDALGTLDCQQNIQLKRLSLAPQEVTLQQTDRQVAGQLAQAIHAQLAEGGDKCSR